ncbi:MAG: hypothetical protein QW303_08255 [Nitrososphaerota archaeon]
MLTVNQIKKIFSKNKIIIITTLFILVVAILIIFSTTTKPKKHLQITPSSYSPKLTENAKIVLKSTAPNITDQSKTIRLNRQAVDSNHELVQNLLANLNLPAKPTRTDETFEGWVTEDQTLIIYLDRLEIVYNKNFIQDPSLLSQSNFKNQQEIINLGQEFIKKNLADWALPISQSPEINYWQNTGVQLMPTSAYNANTATLTYYFQTLKGDRLIGATGTSPSLVIKIIPDGRIIGFEMPFGIFTIDDGGDKKISLTPKAVANKFKNQPTVIHAFGPQNLSEATDIPKYQDLKEVVVDKIYPAYYFQNFENFPQIGNLVIVGEGDGVTFDNQRLRVWLVVEI